SPQEAQQSAISNIRNRKWRMLLDIVSQSDKPPSDPGSKVPPIGTTTLARRMLLEQLVKPPALLVIQQLIHPRPALCHYDPVVLPHVIQNTAHLLRLLGRKVQFLLDPGEICG